MNVVADEAGIDWIGCQVLVVVPRSHADLASSVVRRVRRAIQDDPLLVDMARVGVTVGPDDWTDDPDQVARVLRQELVSWTMSPAAVRASRIVFGILLLHDDLAEAERFIDTLAGTEAMSTLPVAFRSAALPAGTRPTDEPVSGAGDPGWSRRRTGTGDPQRCDRDGRRSRCHPGFQSDAGHGRLPGRSCERTQQIGRRPGTGLHPKVGLATGTGRRAGRDVNR